MERCLGKKSLQPPHAGKVIALYSLSDTLAERNRIFFNYLPSVGTEGNLNLYNPNVHLAMMPILHVAVVRQKEACLVCLWNCANLPGVQNLTEAEVLKACLIFMWSFSTGYVKSVLWTPPCQQGVWPTLLRHKSHKVVGRKSRQIVTCRQIACCVCRLGADAMLATPTVATCLYWMYPLANGSSLCREREDPFLDLLVWPTVPYLARSGRLLSSAADSWYLRIHSVVRWVWLGLVPNSVYGLTVELFESLGYAVRGSRRR